MTIRNYYKERTQEELEREHEFLFRSLTTFFQKGSYEPIVDDLKREELTSLLNVAREINRREFFCQHINKPKMTEQEKILCACGLNPNNTQSEKQQKDEREHIAKYGKCSACEQEQEQTDTRTEQQRVYLEGRF